MGGGSSNDSPEYSQEKGKMQSTSQRSSGMLQMRQALANSRDNPLGNTQARIFSVSLSASNDISLSSVNCVFACKVLSSFISGSVKHNRKRNDVEG